MKILQIGANKGNTDNDPIWKLCQENLPESLKWDLWLVEPNIKAVEILRKNYLDCGFQNVKCIPFAISDKFEDVILYVDNDIPGNEGSQHSSLNKKHLFKMGHTDSVIVEKLVKAIPLNSILWGKIDFLQIDTEGYDGKILLGADLTHDIKKIQFEHCHLEQNEFKQVVEKLISYDYCLIFKDREDCIFKKVSNVTRQCKSFK